MASLITWQGWDIGVGSWLDSLLGHISGLLCRYSLTATFSIKYQPNPSFKALRMLNTQVYSENS